jgi:hypothetical protein
MSRPDRNRQVWDPQNGRSLACDTTLLLRAPDRVAMGVGTTDAEAATVNRTGCQA